MIDRIATILRYRQSCNLYETPKSIIFKYLTFNLLFFSSSSFIYKSDIIFKELLYWDIE